MDIEKLLITSTHPSVSNKSNKEKKSNTSKKQQNATNPQTSTKPRIVDKSQLLTEEKFKEWLIEDHIKEQKRSMSYKKTIFTPTDLVENCPRKIYYRFVNAEYELSTTFPYVKFIAKVGDSLHELLQNMLQKRFQNVQSEIPFEVDNDEFKVRGRIDLYYETENSVSVLCEIKSIGDEIFNANFKGKNPHWKQLAIYYYVWKYILNRNVDVVQLIYLCREFKPRKINQFKLEPIKILTVSNPDKMWHTYKNEIFETYKLVTEAIKLKQPPIIPKYKELSIKQYDCPWCPYKTICNKDFQSMVKIDLSDIPL